MFDGAQRVSQNEIRRYDGATNNQSGSLPRTFIYANPRRVQNLYTLRTVRLGCCGDEAGDDRKTEVPRVPDHGLNRCCLFELHVNLLAGRVINAVPFCVRLNANFIKDMVSHVQCSASGVVVIYPGSVQGPPWDLRPDTGCSLGQRHL